MKPEIIGKIDPELKARIDRVQEQIQALNDGYEDDPDVYQDDVWKVLIHDLYELVEMV